MNIEQGLFSNDFTDYHAILGVSLDADAKQIRKRYLKIARKLHPDSLAGATDGEKQRASELLSKMVNPAYEKLTQEKEMAEHKVVLRMRGQQLSRQSTTLSIQTAAAKALLGAGDALNLYNSDLKKLAEQQYESLEQVLDITGQISELNLAYLVSSAGNTAATAPSTPVSASKTGDKTPATTARRSAAPPPPPPSPRQQRESIIDSYLNRAQEFERKKNYSKAILEMREAVKAHPNNAACHSQLANLYLKVSQATMARIHLKRALEIDPNNALARQLKPEVSKANEGKAVKSNQKSSQSKSRGGLFGLFGGKQK